MPPFPDHAQLSNLALIEELYKSYLQDPASVDLSWRHFFEGIDFGAHLYARSQTVLAASSTDERLFKLVQNYRRFGHLKARFNPLEEGAKQVDLLDPRHLGFSEAEMEQTFPTFGFCAENQAPLKQIVAALEAIYCQRIGFEYTDLGQEELEQWIQQKIEPKLSIEPPLEERLSLLESLYRAEGFETFLHTKYTGQTRFSLEGAETMIPLLAEMVQVGGELGIEQFLIGMAHRGRLNVLANLLNKPYALLFQEFEDDTTLSFSGNDDVRYHMGFSGQFQIRSGKKVLLEMAANPSHLESVDPVILGETRALQVKSKDTEKTKVCPLLIHGDASLAGQGVIYECLQFSRLPDYATGGTLHLVVNNQIGYTTLPQEGRSTRYCTDIAKTFSAPVFHVNAEDPESCLFVAQLATEIRQKFHCDVFIDLVCYRKYGHNEGDEPSYTQPVQYQQIRAKKTIRQMYAEQLIEKGLLDPQREAALETQFKEALKNALTQAQEAKKTAPVSSEKISSLLEPFASGVPANVLQQVADAYCQVPQTFHLHPKLQKWVQDRRNAVQIDPAKPTIDWATAECLALGSLLLQEVPIRLAGQDAKRGTFSQRHLVWIDAQTGASHSPLGLLQKGRLDVVNSPLTEFAGLGFEYGYSWAYPESFVLWEAQYGDFFNGAQIIVDQYLVSAEQKWNCSSSITLLLPHAYEGAGPEHSSARMERFLQLAAHQNIQVVNASTPAQYFHLLRRQALRKPKKPLIVFTPKSLLRAPACTSALQEFIQGQFEEVLDDPKAPAQPKKLLFCSGKVFYDLLAEREKRKETQTAIVRIEQIYPLHLEKIKSLLQKYKGIQTCLWVQEEPENMGAWNFIGPYLQMHMPANVKFGYVGRAPSSTTATGSNKKHKIEQQALLDEAFS